MLKKNFWQHLAKQKNFKTLTWIALWIMALLLPFAWGRFRRPNLSEAAWFDNNWGFRKQVPLSNSSGSTKTNFQVNLTIDTATLVTAGKLQSDCDDLRFTDQNGKPLNYWIEPTTCNTATTKVWVKVLSIPSATTGVTANIYYYYGNPSASAGQTNPDQVFIKDMVQAAVAWPLDDTTSTQSYSRAENPALSTGREMVINGGFDSDTGWTKQTGWTITGGVVHSDGTGSYTGVNQNLPLVYGKSYEVTYTISNYVQGAIKTQLGSTYGAGRSANGTFTETVTPGTGGIAGINIYSTSPTQFIGDIDNISVKQVSIPASTSFTGTELLTDGNMEAADTNSWTGARATLTKETTNPHGGSRTLRATSTATGGAAAYCVQHALTAGKTYRINGYARSDGTVTPKILHNSTTYWTGTNSTSWQYFDITLVAGNTDVRLEIGSAPPAGNYAEFDDLSVIEVNPLVGKPTNGVTLGSSSGTGGHLTNAYTFDGSNDYVNIYSSDLNSTFNPDEGTLVVWAKVSNAGVWTDGQNRVLFVLQTPDGQNIIRLYKAATNNALSGFIARSNTSTFPGKTDFSSTDWFQVVLTWSKNSNQDSVYINGVPGTSTAHPGEWIGNIYSGATTIGALGTTGTQPWSGMINDVRLYTRALSTEEIASLYSTSSDRQVYTTANYTGRELVREYSTLVTVGSVGAEETSTGPIAYWMLDEGAGQNVQDSSRKNNSGTLGADASASTDDPTWKTEDQCVSGKCLFFDGGDHLQGTGTALPNVGNSSNITLSAWVKITSNSGRMTVFNKGLSGNCFNYGMVINNGILTARNTSNDYSLVGTVPVNTWTHVLIVFNSSGATGYINGQQVGANATATTKTCADTNWTVGKRAYNATSDYLSGFVDEVKVYPYAFTADQILKDYNKNSAVIIGSTSTQNLPSNGLVGYWKMDETSGTTVADASGNNNTGTLTNAQESGTSDASGNSTTTMVDTDSASLSSTDDAYNGMILRFTNTCGSIPSGTERYISDYVGSSKTITLESALTTAPDGCSYEVRHQIGGKFGNGAHFDHNNDYIDIATFQNLNLGLTYSAWIKPADNNTTKCIIAGKTYSVQICLTSDGNRIQLLARNSSGTWFSEPSYTNVVAPVNQWSHITGVITNEGEMQIYLNGNKVCLDNCTVINNLIATSGIFIGRDNGTNYFNGVIDEARIYNRALSEKEVRDLYNWAPGPVGHWKMDEGSSTAVNDSSGNNNNGTWSGTGSHWISGKYGQAGQFNGTDDYVGLATSRTDQNFTLSAWVKTNALGNYQAVIAMSEGFIQITNAGVVYFGAYDNRDGTGAFHTNSIGTIVPNQWYYLTMTAQGNTLALYINGKYIGAGPSTGTAGGIYTSPMIGAGGNVGLMRYFNGQIDDVKVYDYVRTVGQITEDMNGGHPVGGSPVGSQAAYWKFDEQQGQTANDYVQTINGTLGANSGSSTDDPTWKSSSDCKINGCLYFDGGDYVTVADNSALKPANLTVSTWVKLSTPLASQTYGFPLVVDKYTLASNTGYRILFDKSSDNLQFGIFNGSASYTATLSSASSFLGTNWHHFTGTFDGSNLKLYVDGVLKSTTSITTSIAYSNETMYIGSYDGTTHFIQGYIDDVKIYSTALTADQVKQDMNAGSSMSLGNVLGANEAADLADGAGNPPVAEWKFDENTGTSANDTSGNNNTGTLSGATWTLGKIGNALNFARGQSVSTNYNWNNLSNATVEAWVKFNSSGVGTIYDGIFGGVGAESNTLFYYTNSLYWRTNNTQMSKSFTPTANTWYHIVATKTGSTGEIYVNGVSLGTGTVGSTFSSSNVALGHINSTSPEYALKGTLDGVKIYNYVRTPAQIAYDYNRGGPVAYYRLDECQGSTTYDAAGNNHGTITIGASGTQTAVGTCNTSGTAWGNGLSGKFSSSMNFDGTDDYLCSDTNNDGTCDNNNNLNITGATSYSVWVKTTDSAGQIMGSAATNTGDIKLTIGLGGGVAGYVPSVFVSSGDATYNNSKTINDNAWHHLAVVYIPSTSITLYLDGQQIAQDTSITNASDTNNPFYIGGTSYYFTGQIDDVQIYNYALSATQIKKLYNQNSAFRFGPN